ncbi:hypothetical protein cand_035620 [Cryptosporidium andersoni]|uniref:CAAX prenyl protease 2/Lysostaphin resistance protein A-like domain-containing protein n=1 Tax=Cryptosporidium andersoni TaxID=117008 RepID=A0A1J4MVN4_9CRYT|nr:hypothetical protein cand_035620 [Cryptosporidium andersoni]
MNLVINLSKLLVIGISPTLCVFLCMSIFSNGWLAMYSMHWICMMIFPCLYTGNFYINEKYVKLKLEKMDLCIYIGCISFIFVFSTFIFYLFSFGPLLWFDILNIRNIKEKLRFQNIISKEGEFPAFSIFSCIYFLILNPFIEEIFWRSFLQNEIESCIQTFNYRNELIHSEVNLLSSNNKESTFKYISVNRLCLMKFNEITSIITSILYSLYHYIVFSNIISVKFAILSCILLVLVGRLLIYVIIEFGIIKAICIHIGIDLSVVLSLGLIVMNT